MVKFVRTLSIASLCFLGLLGLQVDNAVANKGWSGGHGSGCEKSFDPEKKFFWKANFYLVHADTLGLTDAQTEKIKNLKVETKKAVIRQQANIDIVSVDFESKLMQEKIDVEATNKLVDEKCELKKAKIKYLVQALANLKEILTPEQHAKAKKMWLGKFGKWDDKD